MVKHLLALWSFKTVKELTYNNIRQLQLEISLLGRYACQVVPIASSVSQQISTMEVKLHLSVTVQPMKLQAQIEAAPLILSFLPPFFTHNAEIHVSTLTPLSSVRISTIPELSETIQVFNSSLCYVTKSLDLTPFPNTAFLRLSQIQRSCRRQLK